MIEPFTNKLISESSPYLLQHAHNPVDWYPWGEEALNKAKESGKPILVSIGYSACHWCHVMERESFEDVEVARYMNEHFINIKIDREERPDLDHIYMDAVQAIAGNGGWPLNVFLTTDAKPFYGGTYFPPQKAFNRPSWKDVLIHINDAWNTRREELEKQAETLVKHISIAGNEFGKKNDFAVNESEAIFTKEQCHTIAENILKNADTTAGGFGKAPKFPQTFTIQYLLAYGHFMKHEKALEQATLSLSKMLEGGIYDHLAGGMARYSTDSNWLAPHFEKMLYDNALLVSVLADAYQVTSRPDFEAAIHKTLGFFINEMKHPEAGFFAALDADSEGEEGRFYVWDKKEIDAVLASDSELYCKWYSVTENGNWERKNILHITRNEKDFVEENNISPDAFKKMLATCNKKLLAHRNRRTRPLTDDKILLGWNALFLTSLCKASAALKNESYKKEAIELFNFINEKFSSEGRIQFHTYKHGKARFPAFLDDYAYFIQACISLQEITGNQDYLLHAKQLTQHVIDNFENTETGYFYFTNRMQKDVVTRKVELYDGAVPSGNSIMAENLFYLAAVFDLKEWEFRAQKITQNLVDTIVKYPTSFAVWASLILKRVLGNHEIVLTGNHTGNMRELFMEMYLPNKVFQSADNEVTDFPLLKGKLYAEKPLFYWCRFNACYEPGDTFDELELLLKKTVY